MIRYASLAVSALLLTYFANPSWADDDHGKGKHYRSVNGAYTAQLDLSPLGIDRVESFGFVLHADRTVVASSEHEVNDLESAGIGVWDKLRGAKVAMGVFNFRMGTEGGCAGIFEVVPPGNCILKLGATMKRVKGGGLVGNAFLSFETLDGVAVPIPVPLPLVMERIRLEDFPRPMAAH